MNRKSLLQNLSRRLSNQINGVNCLNFKRWFLGGCICLTALFLSATERPAADFMLPDGTLNLRSGFSGSLNLSGWQVEMDACRGPVLKPTPPTTGLFSAMGSGMNGNVVSIAVNGSTVYAGGQFTTAGGVAVSNIAKWDGSSWSAMGSGMDGVVWAIAVSGSTVYAGGGFSTAGSVSANNIAKWNGSSWSAMGSGTGATVFALGEDGSTIYAGGVFTTPASHIAQWNGSSWSGMGSGMNDAVLAIVVTESAVYAGGSFTTAGGVSADKIATWDGASWSGMASGMNNSVFAIAVDGSTVYAAGNFNTPTSNIAKWDGSTWSALGSGTNGIVYALAVSGSNLYAGGGFTTAGGVSVSKIAKWGDASWSALGTGMDIEVDALAGGDGFLYAGGAFIMADGTTVNRIANGANALPVELINFSAKNMGSYNLLAWHTASETNNEGFEVQHSFDAQTWQVLRFINGKGSTNEPQVYSWIDEQPMPGPNYYRLRQVDFDGAEKFSPVVNVMIQETNTKLQIQPNPVSQGLLSIRISGADNVEAILRLFDLSGRQVRQAILTDQESSLDTQGLPSGIYLLEVKMSGEIWRGKVQVE